MKILLKKLFDPFALSVFFLVILIFLLLIITDVLSVKVIFNKNSVGESLPQKKIEKESTSSAWYSDPIKPTPKLNSKLNQSKTQKIPTDTIDSPDQDTKINSNNENYIYPVYIQDTYTQPVRNYDPLYMKFTGQTYSCLDTRHTEILLAQEDYFKTVDEITKICLNSDLTTYEICATSCSPDNYTVCEKECYNKIDWTCGINPTESPEYRTLEHLLSMYCK